LVTGGAGFIGSHVAAHLLERGDRVVVVDEVNDYYDVRIKRNNLKMLKATYGDRVAIYEGDICDADLMSRVYENEAPNFVCHLAARAGVRPSIQDPYVYIHSNVEGTTRLLDLARANGCEHFVFASSSSVYGGSNKEVFSEDDVVDFPVSPYAATKKACELIAYTYYHLYGLNVAGLRFFTVYGPRGRPDMAPFKFIDRISRGVAVQQFGDGSSSRDYTYIDDIVDGVVRALDRPLGYQVYNLGNGMPVPLSEFIHVVEECVQKEAKIQVMPEQPGDVPRTCADISKARRLLGYSPKTPFREGIRRTVDWYKQAVVEHDISHNPEYGTYGGLCRSNSNVQLEPATSRLSSSSRKSEHISTSTDPERCA
jgi:UDP-glucuronate 4-epimerase